MITCLFLLINLSFCFTRRQKKSLFFFIISLWAAKTFIKFSPDFPLHQLLVFHIFCYSAVASTVYCLPRNRRVCTYLSWPCFASAYVGQVLVNFSKEQWQYDCKVPVNWEIIKGDCEKLQCNYKCFFFFFFVKFEESWRCFVRFMYSTKSSNRFW